jgi:hypothetical protein
MEKVVCFFNLWRSLTSSYYALRLLVFPDMEYGMWRLSNNFLLDPSFPDQVGE